MSKTGHLGPCINTQNNIIPSKIYHMVQELVHHSYTTYIKIYIILIHVYKLVKATWLSSKTASKMSRLLERSLKSLTTYHSKNRKIFRLSQILTKLFWVTRFRETNLTAQSVSSSEIQRISGFQPKLPFYHFSEKLNFFSGFTFSPP